MVEIMAPEFFHQNKLYIFTLKELNVNETRKRPSSTIAVGIGDKGTFTSRPDKYGSLYMNVLCNAATAPRSQQDSASSRTALSAHHLGRRKST